MAKQGHFEEHWVDENGNPSGGVSFGTGFAISWQHGPLERDGNRIQPNGAFVEDVIQVVIGRIAFYQDSKFACQENEDALVALKKAAERLNDRMRERETRLVEGTHTV